MSRGRKSLALLSASGDRRGSDIGQGVVRRCVRNALSNSTVAEVTVANFLLQNVIPW